MTKVCPCVAQGERCTVFLKQRLATKLSVIPRNSGHSVGLCAVVCMSVGAGNLPLA